MKNSSQTKFMLLSMEDVLEALLSHSSRSSFSDIGWKTEQMSGINNTIIPRKVEHPRVLLVKSQQHYEVDSERTT